MISDSWFIHCVEREHFRLKVFVGPTVTGPNDGCLVSSLQRWYVPREGGGVREDREKTERGNITTCPGGEIPTPMTLFFFYYSVSRND